MLRIPMNVFEFSENAACSCEMWDNIFLFLSLALAIDLEHNSVCTYT